MIKPTQVLTVTEDGEAHLWTEEMTLRPDFLHHSADINIAAPVADGNDAAVEEYEVVSAFTFIRSCSL